MRQGQLTTVQSVLFLGEGNLSVSNWISSRSSSGRVSEPVRCVSSRAGGGHRAQVAGGQARERGQRSSFALGYVSVVGREWSSVRYVSIAMNMHGTTFPRFLELMVPFL